MFFLHKVKEIYRSSQFEKMTWHQREGEFGNTPLLTAVAEGQVDYISSMLSYIEAKPELHYIFSAVNIQETLDACNNPLLLAIKNGDQATACRLLPYYSTSDLMHYDNNGSTALQLACYLKLNQVVEGILKRAETLNCRENLLRQQNPFHLTAYDLYIAPFEEPTAKQIYQYGRQIGYYWVHDKIFRYEEAVMKHLFNASKHVEPINENLVAQLKPAKDSFDYLQAMEENCYFFPGEDLSWCRRVSLSPNNHSLVEYIVDTMIFNTAQGLLCNQQWQTLITFLEQYPNLISKEHQFRHTELIFSFAKYADDSELCRETSTLLFSLSDWKIRNTSSENTPFLEALDQNNPHALALMLEYINSHPDLHALLSEDNAGKIEKDRVYTPLNLAIKNGDTKTACVIIPFYSSTQLLFIDNNQQSALQLASYLKLNEVILAILEQAKKTNCLEECLAQKNPSGYTAHELYEDGEADIVWTHTMLRHYDLQRAEHACGKQDPVLLDKLKKSGGSQNLP